MPEAARLTDMHECPRLDPIPHVGGPVLAGSPDILIEDLPAARATDPTECAAESPDRIAQGSGTVVFNDLLASRVDDKTEHAGTIIVGSPTVEIGEVGDAVTVLPIRGRGVPHMPSPGGSGPGEGGGSTGGAGTPGGSEQDDQTSTSDGNVFARFDILPEPPLRRGTMIRVRCRSWDPDTGGTPAAPNPEAMVSRSWELTGGSPYVLDAYQLGNAPAEWEVLLKGYEDYDPGMVYQRCTIRLTVVDAQGHTATAEQSFEVWDSPKPQAVITRVAIQEQIGNPGFIPSLRFRCDSYEDQNAPPVPTPERIRERVWRARGSAGVVPVAEVAGSAHREVEIDGRHLAETLRGGSIQLELQVENFYNEFSQTSIEVTSEPIDLRIVESRVLALDPSDWQHSLRPDLLVEADGLWIRAESEGPDPHAGYEWTVTIGGATRHYSTQGLELHIPVVDAGGLRTNGASIDVSVYVRGLHQQVYASRNTLKRWVNPSLTLRNAAEAIARALLEKGVSVGVALAVGAVTGGVGAITWVAAGTALAGGMISQGMLDLGAPPWLASLLIASVSRGGEVLRFKIDPEYAASVLRQEMLQEARRHGVSIVGDPQAWNRIVRDKLASELRTVGHWQTRELLKDIITDISDSVRREYVGTFD